MSHKELLEVKEYLYKAPVAFYKSNSMMDRISERNSNLNSNF